MDTQKKSTRMERIDSVGKEKKHDKKEQRRNVFLDKYKDKIHLAGVKHGSVKQVLSIINNTKSNPRNLFVAEGLWAIEKAVDYNLEAESFFFSPELIYSTEAERLTDKLINTIDNVFMVSDKTFQRISDNSGRPDGLLALFSLPSYILSDIDLKQESIIIILDAVEIPGNIGTIIRTVDGANADAVFVCNRRARLTHPKVIRGSQGAVLKVSVVEDETDKLIEWLTEHYFTIYLTDTDAKKRYYEENYQGRVAIVVGSERYGISKEWYQTKHRLISIPMLGDVDSLNVAVSTSIILYEASMKQKGMLDR
jgi:RNA methyltransferase, TrmH family